MARLTPEFIAFLRHYIARIEKINELRQIMGGFGWRIDEVRKTYNNAMNCFMILKD